MTDAGHKPGTDMTDKLMQQKLLNYRDQGN